MKYSKRLGARSSALTPTFLSATPGRGSADPRPHAESKALAQARRRNKHLRQNADAPERLMPVGGRIGGSTTSG